MRKRYLKSHVAILAGLLIMLVAGAPIRAQTPRPNEAEGATRLEALVYMRDVNSIDTVLQKFDADVNIALRWRDPRLAHNGPNEIRKPLSDIWHPAVVIANELEASARLPDVVRISPAGEVTYRQLFSGTFAQPMNLRDFPFDTQKFSVRWMVTDYTSEEIEVVSAKEQELGMAKRTTAPNWTVTGWRAEARPYEILPGYRTLAGYEFTFDAQRGGGYYILKVIIPLVLILMMSWVVFWLEPTEVGSQLSVSITTILTLIAYRFAIGSYTPDLSYFTKLDYFVFGSTLLVFASLLEVMITTRLAARGKAQAAKKVDRWCRWLFPVATILMAIETLSLRVFH